MAINYSGPDLQVAFNPAFLIDPLKAAPQGRSFLRVKTRSVRVFKTLGSFVCVIMPCG